MHDKMSVNDFRLLELVGDDTTYKVRMSGVEGVHQLVELLLFPKKN